MPNINVLLSENNREQAQRLREHFFNKDTSSGEIRDAYIFQYCIERFDEANSQELENYIGKDKDGSKNQRMLMIREEMHEKLQRIAESLHRPMAPILRALILYTLAQIDNEAGDGEDVPPSGTRPWAEPPAQEPQLAQKVLLLQNQLQLAQNNLAEILLLVQKSGGPGAEDAPEAPGRDA